MIQEIISYVVIGSAFSFVALKSVRFFGGATKKKNSKCSSCSAECMLKDISLKDNDTCPNRKELDYYL